MKFIDGHLRMDLSKSINFKTDPELYQEVQDILSILGISVSAAINLYFSQIVMSKGIPFDCTVDEVADYIAIFNKKGDSNDR